MGLYLVCGALGVVALLVSRATPTEAYAVAAAGCVLALLAIALLEGVPMGDSGGKGTDA
jgi:hypothetical protein